MEAGTCFIGHGKRILEERPAGFQLIGQRLARPKIILDKLSLFFIVYPGVIDVRFLTWLLFPILFQGFNFGDKFPRIKAFSSSGEAIAIPVPYRVNVFFLFNPDNPSHNKMVEEMDLMIANLPGEPIYWACITSKRNRGIDRLNRNIQAQHSFIIDEKKQIFRLLSFSCGACIKVFIVDKQERIRYVSSSYDPVFLRTIIARYSEEK